MSPVPYFPGHLFLGRGAIEAIQEVLSEKSRRSDFSHCPHSYVLGLKFPISNFLYVLRKHKNLGVNGSVLWGLQGSLPTGLRKRGTVVTVAVADLCLLANLLPRSAQSDTTSLFLPHSGPFKPCEHLFGSWLIRIGVWTTAVLALSCNALVAFTVFRTPLYISSIKLLIGVIAVVDILMGVSSAILAVVDTFTFGSFAQHGAWWEGGIGCQIVGFLSIFASESSVFLLTLAALERGFSVKCSSKFEMKAPLSSLKAIILLCVLLALTIATVPLLGGSEYNASPLCLPLPFGEPSTTGYMVALVLLNSLCFLIMTIAYTRLYCSLEKGELENLWDCSMVKHTALLLFTNCILYCPVAFLSFSSLLNLTFISPEVIKFILLVIVPLPACLNPLLYIVFNPHFKEDMGSLGKQTRFWTRAKHPSLLSINSDDVEKRSCDSTQALVSFTHASIAYDLPSDSGSSPAYPMTESCHLSSVAFVPCL